MNELAHVEIETEKVLADFLWNEVALALLIEYFWISDGKHSDIFLDGILAIYFWYGLQKKEYEVMRDYSGGEKLWEKFSFRIQSILELGGVRQDMSSQMAEFMSQHFSSALQAHRIYDIVSSPEKLEEEYTIVAKSKKYGSILVKDNTPEIYLLQWKTVYFYSDMTINRQNKIEAIIFPFWEKTLICYPQKNEFIEIDGTFWWLFWDPWYEWIQTYTESQENCTILKTRECLKLERYRDETDMDANIKRFIEYFPGEGVNERPAISHFWVSVYLINEKEKPSVRCKKNQTLRYIDSQEEIFSCHGDILNFVQTSFGKFVFYVSTEYSNDIQKPEEKVFSVYSLEEEKDIQRILVDDQNEFHILSDYDTCILIVRSEWKKVFFDLQSWLFAKDIDSLSVEKQADGSHFIQYKMDAENPDEPVKYFSTRYSKFRVFVENWEKRVEIIYKRAS